MIDKEQKPKIVLTLLSQQYGLTVEDLLSRDPSLEEEDIVVEQPDTPCCRFVDGKVVCD